MAAENEHAVVAKFVEAVGKIRGHQVEEVVYLVGADAAYAEVFHAGVLGDARRLDPWPARKIRCPAAKLRIAEEYVGCRRGIDAAAGRMANADPGQSFVHGWAHAETGGTENKGVFAKDGLIDALGLPQLTRKPRGRMCPFPEGAVCLVLGEDECIGAPGALLRDAELQAGVVAKPVELEIAALAAGLKQDWIPKLVAALPVRGLRDPEKGRFDGMLVEPSDDRAKGLNGFWACARANVVACEHGPHYSRRPALPRSLRETRPSSCGSWDVLRRGDSGLGCSCNPHGAKEGQCPRRKLFGRTGRFVATRNLLRGRGAVSLWACVLVAGAVARLSLLPQPKQVEEIGSSLKLGNTTVVYVSPATARDEDALFAAKDLTRLLEEARVQAQLKVALPPAGGGWLALGIPDGDPVLAQLAAARGLKITNEMAAEGYALSVTGEGVVLVAGTPAGLFYGVQTLRQLLRRVGSRAELPGVRIHDWPTMRLRGIMHDTSRCQVPTVETARRIIDFCAQYKLNFYSPYIEHTFAWEGHEDIWRGSGAWSPREYVELCQYARPRHVMVIPQFEAMGHQNNILTKERYRHMAETGGWSFAPAVDDTYVLLDDLLGQMSRAFPFHPFLGIGCDEVYDLGAGKSRELMEKLGGKGPLFAYHIRRLTEILARYGRRPMMWGDMMLNHPEAMGLVPKEVIVLDWHYGDAPQYPSVRRFREAGYDVVVCPALSSWVRIFPDYFNAFGNIQHLYAEGQKNGALGGMTCNWGDWGAENFCAYNWFGWAWAAACSWGDAASQDRQAFGRDFCATFYGATSTDLAEAHWELARGNGIFPWGTHPIGYFHADPFTATHPPAKRSRRLAEAVEKARRLLQEGARRATRNADTVQYLAHAAARYEYVARRGPDVARAADLYSAAFEATDAAVRRAKLAECQEVLQGLRDDLAALRDEFRRLWLAENRPEGLEFDLAKFQAGLDSYDARLAAVRKAIEGGELAAPEALGLQRRVGRVGLPVNRADLALPEKWWDERWPYRVPLRIEAGDADRPAGLPVVIALALSNLCGEAVEPSSPRLVVDGEAYAAQLLPLWGPDGEFAPVAVAFLLPRAVPKGGSLDAVLYWAPEGSSVPAAETDLVVEEGQGQIWVENGRLRVMLGAEGAHLFVWQVKALGAQDITQPGETDWAGFLDYNWCRRSSFSLKVLARGPVAAVVHCEDPEGTEKLVLVWAGLPLVDMIGDTSSWFWNYDATSDFAADSPTPGMGRFEDGTEAPIPAGGETIHLEPSRPVWWCAKYRADGLTLGLITPNTPTGMMIGPGGGWGGVGMDHSPHPTDRFVTYCDVTAEKWRAVATLAEAMRADRPMRALIGPPARLR